MYTIFANTRPLTFGIPNQFPSTAAWSVLKKPVELNEVLFGWSECFHFSKSLSDDIMESIKHLKWIKEQRFVWWHYEIIPVYSNRFSFDSTCIFLKIETCINTSEKHSAKCSSKILTKVHEVSLTMCKNRPRLLLLRKKFLCLAD